MARKKNRPVRGGRTFLNPSHGLHARVVWSAQVCSRGPEDGEYISAAFDVADCGRTASLEFTAFSKASAQRHLKKIGRLRREIERFETEYAAMVAASDWRRRRKGADLDD